MGKTKGLLIIIGIIATGVVSVVFPRIIELSGAQQPLFFPVCFGITVLLFPAVLLTGRRLFAKRPEAPKEEKPGPKSK